MNELVMHTVRVIHKPTAKVRRVTGKSGNTLHFAQVIKVNGETFYWADTSECTVIPDSATGFDVRVAVFMQGIRNKRSAVEDCE